MDNIASEINNGLGALKVLYSLAKITIVKAKTRLSTPLRIEKLTDDVFSGNIKYGTVVTVNGILSKYGTVFRPSAYAYAIPRNTKRTKVGVLTKDTKTGRYVQNNELITTLRPFQFPVQTLPKLSNEDGDYKLAFLYPTHFVSFLFQPDPNEESGRKQLKESNYKLKNRPIPVLISEKELENYSETDVTLTGVVSLFPDNLLDIFSKSICEIRKDFFSSFFRPYSNRIAFCLDCRDKINSDIKSNKKLQTLPAAIYVEGHFEGTTDDKYKEQYKQSIPKGLLFEICYDPYPGMSFYLTEHDEVSIMSFNTNIFGFYIETDLVDQRKFHYSLNVLQEFYTQFHKKSCNAVRKIYGDNLKFKPDFVFDFKKQFLFHPDGVLNSAELKLLIKENQDINETVSWIKKEN